MFSSFTCAHISPTYCSTTGGTLMKNIIYRILLAVKSIADGLFNLDDYLTNHNCGTDDDNKYALLVAVDTFGSILTSASVLLEAAKYEYSLYTVISAGASTYTSNLYGRASSPSGNSAAYQGFRYQAQGPYRYQRGAVLGRTPAVVPVLVG